MKSRWTKEEELEFIKGVAGGKSMDELSQVHDRTSTALELRLKKIVYDNMIKGKNAEGLARNLHIHKDKVLQYYFAYIDFREKNGKDVKRINVDTSSKKSQHGGHRKSHNSSKHKKEKSRSKSRSKSKSKTIDIKHHSGGNINEKISNKIGELEKQNKLLDTIIKNNQMKSRVKKLYKEDKLDSTMRKMVKKMKDNGIL